MKLKCGEHLEGLPSMQGSEDPLGERALREKLEWLKLEQERAARLLLQDSRRQHLEVLTQDLLDATPVATPTSRAVARALAASMVRIEALDEWLARAYDNPPTSPGIALTHLEAISRVSRLREAEARVHEHAARTYALLVSAQASIAPRVWARSIAGGQHHSKRRG